MKILLFGGSGQLGYEVMARCRDLNFEVLSPVQSEINITEREQVVRLAEHAKPTIILNCAAYTAVDKAEQEPEAAFRLNQEGARNAALAAKACGARLIYVSTDYVFDGSAKEPIPESATPAPLNVYGKSKLAGEQEVLQCLDARALVVRTSSLHGQKGVNFVHTMLNLFRERDVVSVVHDQFMSPTWAGWLAETLLDLCRIECSGILHACGAGVCSWHEFATAIYEDSRTMLGRVVRIEPVPAAQFPRPARRPAYSAMSTAKLTRVLGRSPLPWREGLRRHLVELKLRADSASHDERVVS